jgi:peptidoglycan/LPS O-acetylase OafA/YrhL
MAGKKNRHMFLLYGFFALLLASVGSLYLTFVFGTMLAYIVVRKESWLERIQSSTPGIVCAVLMLLFGLFLGGYPSGVIPTNIYRFLNHLPDTISAYEFYHMIGAALITGAIFCLSGIQKFLSAKPIQFLGNISFAVYLLNLPLVFSLSSGLAIIFYNTQLVRNYGLLALLIFVISTVSLLLLSYLFHRFVEPVCDKITSAIVSYFIQ